MLPAGNESWDVIVDWLGQHSPPELTLIRPPAAEDDIRDAARIVGTALPDDLVAWWRRADGQAGKGNLLPPFYSPYSVRTALDRRDVWMTAWNGVMEQASGEQFAAQLAQEDRAPAGSPCKGAWLPRWLPIAGDGGGNDLFVDLRPGPAHGCVRQFLRDDGAGDAAWWGGVAAMLAEVAAALTHEVPVRGHRIWVDGDGTIAWDRDVSRWAAGGSALVNVARLRERYAAFVAEVRAGGFTPPPAGQWSAEWIAAHVARNTELLIATTRAVLEDNPAGRYDNSDAMDPATLDRYADSGLAALADRISRLGARLCDLVEPLNRGRPTAHVRIIDTGITIVDGRQGWLGVLNALSIRQLPLRTRQLGALH
jgi:cell wall assembly regulator SMI1